MDKQINKINDNTFYIEDNGVRIFILVGNNKIAIIDSGMTITNLKNIIKSISNKEMILINTHTDKDHINCNDEFDIIYMHENEIENYRQTHKNENIIKISKGDIIDIGNRPLEIIEIFGHTPGSIGILDVNNKMLFSGDPIQDGTIFMFGKTRNMDNYIKSLENLMKITDKFDYIYPSHGTLKMDTKQINYVHDYAKQILNGKIKGENINFHGKEIVKYVFKHASFLCDK